MQLADAKGITRRPTQHILLITDQAIESPTQLKVYGNCMGNVVITSCLLVPFLFSVDSRNSPGTGSVTRKNSSTEAGEEERDKKREAKRRGECRDGNFNDQDK